MSKDERRSRYERRKSKHVRDIRRKDYICNQREAVEYGGGESHNDGAAYGIARGRKSQPISRGGGYVAGNPRYSDERGREKQRASHVAAL